MKTKNEKNTNTMTNTNENKEGGSTMILESVYKSVCPKGTHKTINGKLWGIVRRAGKIIVSGRWETLIPQSIGNKEVFDGLVDDFCNGKCPIELTEANRSFFALIICLGGCVARYGKKKGWAIFLEIAEKIKNGEEKVVA